MRITIDNDGICEIERLEKLAPYTGKTFEDLAFLVTRVATFQIYIEAKVCLSLLALIIILLRLTSKDNRFRLRLPKGAPGLATWNTDNPPMPSTLLNPIHLAPIQNGSWQLCAFDLNRCSGVSFFFSFIKLVGVHVHRPGYLSAADEYRRICESRRRTVWIYMPKAPDDQVTALGCRSTNRGVNILVSNVFLGETAY